MQNVYWLTKFNTTKLHGFELRKMSRLYDDQEKQTKKILLFWFYCLKLRNLKLLVYQCISHRRKKKTSACLVLNKKRTWPVMRKSAGCLSRVFITTFSKIGNKISRVLKSHIPWPILALSAKGPTSMNTAIWRWLRFIHFVLQVSIHDCYLK